jgi:hypothetical protein
MQQISKSIFLKIPAHVAYDSIKSVDASSTRYTSDLGFSTADFSTDIPNTFLAASVSVSSFLNKANCRTENHFRVTNEVTSEVTIKMEFENFDERLMKVLLGCDILSLLSLEYGYNARTQS